MIASANHYISLRPTPFPSRGPNSVNISDLILLYLNLNNNQHPLPYPSILLIVVSTDSNHLHILLFFPEQSGFKKCFFLVASHSGLEELVSVGSLGLGNLVRSSFNQDKENS
jgi:hypothetical protein